MAVYILNNRKIVRHKGERLDFVSNEYSIPIRIAQSNSDNNKERTVSLLNSDMTYKVSEDSENSFNKLSLLDNRISITGIFQLTQKYLLRDQVKRTNPLTG
ncbi:hypothetical protein V2E39_02900 [Chryseobacterium arthrosphaerae]|uniref:Uncharacterized protein n=1 Tax=Chryseobacterium arthrosphaerae TaxID=651561 RepID=A0ABU7QUR5_9FLAO|nr:hypothetical protein [Chryseobacterium arthrosphaerae]